MKFIELKKSLDKLNPVYIISGEDRYLCYSALEQITKACGLNLSEMNNVVMTNPNVDELLASCNIYPFMDQFRLVVVNDFGYKNLAKQEKGKLEQYFENPLTSTVLVFFDADELLVKEYKQKVTFVDCSKLSAIDTPNYIVKMFARNQISCPNEAANLLAEYCLFDMTKITAEVEKLVSYCDENKAVTIENIKEMVVKSKEYQIYSLSEYIAKNDAEHALDLVTELSRKSGQGLLSALYSNYRRLLYIAISKETDVTLAEKLNVKEFAIKMARNQIRYFTPKKIMNIVDYLEEIDSGIKKGKIKEDIAVKTAVIQILKIRNS